MILKTTTIDTILGPMTVVADDVALYVLKFVDQKNIKNETEERIIPGETVITKKIKKELNDYFDGKKYQFETPLAITGSVFQKNVWKALKKIPKGETRSYLDIAKSIKKPTAFRAVANANGANKLAIIIPCHRVINANGNLGGYAGGISRKQWLIDHEKKHYG